MTSIGCSCSSHECEPCGSCQAEIRAEVEERAANRLIDAAREELRRGPLSEPYFRMRARRLGRCARRAMIACVVAALLTAVTKMVWFAFASAAFDVAMVSYLIAASNARRAASRCRSAHARSLRP